MVVYSRISWTRLLLVTIGPFVLIVILFFMFSSEKLSEVISYKNLFTPSAFVPVPVLYMAALIIYVAINLGALSVALYSRGRHIWENDRGDILVFRRIKFNARTIEICSVERDENSWRIIITSENNGKYYINCQLADRPVDSIVRSLRCRLVHKG